MDNTTILDSINNLHIAHIDPAEELDEELLQKYSDNFASFVIDEKYDDLLNTFMHVENLQCNNITKCAILYIGSQFVDALVNVSENNC